MMNKKGILIVIIILIVVLLGLVYLLRTGKYSNGGVAGVMSTLQNVVSSSSPTSSPQAQEVGTVTSTKIALTVTSPKDGDTLGSTNITVTGKTSPNADVFVDDQSGKADSNGNFSISLGLDEGSNQIVVSANDSNGNAAEQDLTVNVLTFQ
jgi:hypothetical protein